MAYRASVIKSIQTGTITLNGASSGTATITSVNTATSVVALSGVLATAGQTPAQGFGYLALTNATTVTATVSSATSAVVTFYFTVIEFYPFALKSLQVVNANSGGTATITAVTTGKSWIVERGFVASGAVAIGQQYALVLTNSTTVTAPATGVDTCYGTVVEFK